MINFQLKNNKHSISFVICDLPNRERVMNIHHLIVASTIPTSFHGTLKMHSSVFWRRQRLRVLVRSRTRKPPYLPMSGRPAPSRKWNSTAGSDRRRRDRRRRLSRRQRRFRTRPVDPFCSFYKWSQQMFLWLTSPVPSRYGAGSHVFNSPVFYAVSPPDSNNQRTLIPHAPGGIFQL